MARDRTRRRQLPLWMRSSGVFPVLAALLTPALLAPERPLAAQGWGEDVRVGVTLGGISFVGLVVEYRKESRAVELNVGTWSFRDLAGSLVVKEYLGPGSLRPFFGLGVWTILSPASGPRRTGAALLLIAPVGADWNADGAHHVGASLNINRALWIRRRDPGDTTPPNPRFVPLPAFYYRWRH